MTIHGDREASASKKKLLLGRMNGNATLMEHGLIDAFAAEDKTLRAFPAAVPRSADRCRTLTDRLIRRLRPPTTLET